MVECIGSEMMLMEYSEEMKKNVIQHEILLEAWGEHLVSRHGAAGTFIRKGKYHSEPRPSSPNLDGVEPGSIEFDNELMLHRFRLSQPRTSFLVT